MPLSPDIERDLKALDEKMKKRAARKRFIRFMGGGGFVLWCAIVIGVIADTLSDKSPEHAVLEIAAITLVFPALGLLGWGFVLMLNYFMPLYDW